MCARRVIRSNRAAASTAPSWRHLVSAAWKPGRRSSLPLAGDVGELRDQRPTLRHHEGPDGSLLRLQSESAVALFGGRDPIQPDHLTLPTCPHRSHQHQASTAGFAVRWRLMPRPFALGLL